MNNKQIEIYAAGKTVYCNMVENGEKTGEGYYTFPQNERLKPKKTDFCTVGGEEIYTGDICQIYINCTFMGTQTMDKKLIETLKTIKNKKICVALRKVGFITDIPSDRALQPIIYK